MRQPPAAAIAATFLGISNQLYTTRMNTLLKPQDLNLSQFSLLNHLNRSSKTIHSINDLTEAMEINQPGVTKIVQKLHSAGLIDVSKNKTDSRKREVSITSKGQEKVMKVNMALLPDVQSWFQDWEEIELQQFISYTQRLATWFDQNRLEPKL